MPLFEYRCTVCGIVSEEITSNREQRTIECPECSELSKKIMSVVGWELKGGGVYRTGPPAPQPKSNN